MKKQIALALAGTAAVVAGGLRLVQELVDRGDRDQPATGVIPEDQRQPTAPPAPSPTQPAPPSASPGTPPEGAGAGDTASVSTGPPPVVAHEGATKAELYEIATALKISGRSKMSKSQLKAAIDAAGRAG
jgi:hypothetical protein